MISGGKQAWPTAKALGGKGSRHAVGSVRGQAHWEETFWAKLGAGEGSRWGPVWGRNIPAEGTAYVGVSLT